MDKKEVAEQLVKKYGSKRAALMVCDELSKRLPNINETPPIHRKEEDKYFQYWRFSIPSAINNL